MLPKYVSVDDLAGHDSASVKSYDFTDVPLDDASQIHHERAETKNEADEDMQWDHRESDHVAPRMDPSSPSESSAAHAARAKASRAFAIRAALVGGLSGLLYGYDIGSIGEALPELKEEFGLRTSREEMVVSVMLAGAVIGAALGGFLTDIVGRRRALLSTAFFFCLSTIIMSTSQTFQALLLGRFVAGIAVAWSMLAVVTYLTEVSPVEHRGTVVCANDLMISVGVLLAYCLGWLYEDWHGGWRYKVAFSIVLSLSQLVLMAYMPESPRWYLAKQRRKDAVTAMTAIYGDAQRALVELSALEETDMSHAATRGRHADPMREFRGPLLVCMGLFAFQQFCGQAGALAYMPIILRSGGITPPHVADLAMIIGLSKLMSTAVAMSLVHGKSAPRKPLLLLGGLVIGFGHFLTALSYHFSLTVRWPFTVLGTMLVICGYAVSYGPLIWVVSGEMFPTSIRGRALGLSTVINWLGNLAVGTTFLSVMEQVGGAGGFAIFGVLSLAGAVYVAACVPETGGRTPEEVVEDMKALSVQRVVKGRQGEPHVASEDMEVEIPGVGYSIAPMMHEERRHQEEKQAQSTAHLQHHGLGAAV